MIQDRHLLRDFPMDDFSNCNFVLLTPFCCSILSFFSSYQLAVLGSFAQVGGHIDLIISRASESHRFIQDAREEAIRHPGPLFFS